MTRAPQYVLGIETASRCMGVALVSGGSVLATYEQLTPTPRADNLRDMVERVLQHARLRVDAVWGLAVSHGPGSFTGLRIGVSFVKGFTLQQSQRARPVVGVPTLEVMAHNVWGARGTVCPIVDAKQGKVYAGCYRVAMGRVQRLMRERLGTVQELAPLLQRGTLFLGDGVARYAQALKRVTRRPLRIAPETLWWPRAATVAWLGAQRLARGRRDDPATLIPQYLYADDCSIKKG